MGYKTRRGPILARVVTFVAICMVIVGLGMCAGYCISQAVLDLMLRAH